MKPALLATAIITSAALIPTVAAAEPADSIEDALEETPDWSITVSPLHLLFPVAEVTAELRTHGNWSAAGIVGAGSVSVDDEREFVIEAGGQARYYVAGDFDHGLNLGAEILYVSSTTGMDDIVATGTALGPFIGYKLAARWGATLDAQLGAQMLVVDGDDADEVDAAGIIPLLNLNAGWTF